MSWTDNSEFTETSDGSSRPLVGVTFSGAVREGDEYSLLFEDNGETVETREGERVAFDVTFMDATFTAKGSDGKALSEGDEARLMTGSSRFLSVLAGVMPVDGKIVTVTVDGTGYDAAYSVDAEHPDA